MNDNKNNNKKNKGSFGSAQACFPTEIAEVDKFITEVLERYGESVGDSLFTGDSLFRNAAADLLGAIVTFVLDYLPDEYHTAGTAIELLDDCTWSDDGRIGGPFNLAIFELMSGYRIEYAWNPRLGERIPFVKLSMLARNTDGMHPSDRVRFGIVRGFMPDEDETVKRYCKFTALVPNEIMRMSVRYTALALLKYSFPNEARPSYSIRNIIDNLG